MAGTDPASSSKRVSIGALLASATTVLIFALWRMAATYDAGTGSAGWLWLVFETAIMIWILPIVVLLYCLLGALLVHKGSGARIQSITGGAIVASLAASGLFAIGMFDVSEGGVLYSAPVSISAMTLAGAFGGHVGHAGWFPARHFAEHGPRNDADRTD